MPRQLARSTPVPPVLAREPVRCDCCGEEVIAQRVGDRLVIRVRRHGRMHVGAIVLTGVRLTSPATPPIMGA